MHLTDLGLLESIRSGLKAQFDGLEGCLHGLELSRRRFLAECHDLKDDIAASIAGIQDRLESLRDSLSDTDDDEDGGGADLLVMEEIEECSRRLERLSEIDAAVSNVQVQANEQFEAVQRQASFPQVEDSLQRALRGCSELLIHYGAIVQFPIGSFYDLGPQFWSRPRMQTGKHIDFLQGQNIPANAKTIDRTLPGGGIVSHKSSNLRLKSRQNLERLRRLGYGYVDELATYNGEVRANHKTKRTYHLEWAVQDRAAPRILEWFVPATGVSKAQEEVLQQVCKYAKTRGVQVDVFRVPD